MNDGVGFFGTPPTVSAAASRGAGGGPMAAGGAAGVGGATTVGSGIVWPTPTVGLGAAPTLSGTIEDGIHVALPALTSSTNAGSSSFFSVKDFVVSFQPASFSIWVSP